MCLSPPPGEYEVSIQISGNKSIIINNNGVSLRSIVTDETLPFINTFTRPIEPSRALKLAGKPLEEILCMTIDALKKASNHGSRTSRRRLEECRDLVDKISSRCNG
ncbi:MAG: hypothetical protein GSR86_07570 [Desulfurococcales archaeon]|nr:hypothetical protein [Desulfurococcales archaeon]